MKIKINNKDDKYTPNYVFEQYQKQSKIRNLSEYTIKYQNAYFNKFKKFIEERILNDRH